MSTSLPSRLNIAHAAVARAGTSMPTKWLDDQIMGTPKVEEPAKPPSIAERRAKRLSREQAERMASDLEGYDGRIKGGRLTGEPG